MTKIKKITSAAITALALATASLAVPGQAFAGGHGGHGGGHGHHGHGGGHGHGHGLFGHGHHHGHRHHFVGYNSCWKWSPYGPVNVCNRYY